MSMSFTIEAEKRDEQGSSASRRLRRAGKLPAILYGGENDAQPITLDHNAMVHNLKHDAFYSHILTVKLDGKSEKAILRDVQRHPFKPTIYTWICCVCRRTSRSVCTCRCTSTMRKNARA